ncbi:hypothetical protein ACQ33O_08475 [Ferruginibacter sp. SUN002]|uniref:hypothetical protein n=1 Tax=Ferruginibacter sp. SUN002 TaxID=2937789 RepID=UPI003D36584C
MKKIFQFILSHSIFIAFCAAGLVVQTFQLLHQPIDLAIIAFVFFATLCSYNFYWLLSKKMFGTVFYNAIFFKKEFGKLILLGIACIGMLVCYFLSSISLWNILPGFVLTCLYALPLLPLKALAFTKRLGILKTLILAFTWAYVTVYVPINKSFGESTDSDLFILTHRFLFMLMLCIIFDSRDSAIDKIRGMHSLTTDISKRVLIYLVAIVFMALFAAVLLYEHFDISVDQSIALQVSTIALLITFYFSTKKQGYFFYYFMVDGMMLFSSIATYIASI